MEGLVNYSSEDDQDDYPYTKAAVRERGSGSGLTSTERVATNVSAPLKRELETSLHRKGREGGSERFRTGTVNLSEDKYKIDRKADKLRDYRDKRDNKEAKNSRDMREDGRDYANSHKHDYKKHDDQKHFREPKKDYKREGNDYYKEDKRYIRYDDRKSMYSPNYKDRFNSSKSRYDERKQHDDRFNDERRGAKEERRGGSGSSFGDRKRDFSDNRKTDRRNNDDRRTQRFFNEDRSKAYRPRRSNSPAPSQRNSGNNKYSERKDDNNTRRERKRNSRSKSRSRSHSADNSTESNFASNNNSQHRTAAEELHTDTTHPVEESHVPEKKSLPTARNFEALLSLPLSENAPKPNAVAIAGVSAAAGSNITTATVQLPSYYNPNVINPNKYVEQMQKRKLIWGAKKTEDSASKWGHAQFSQDQDGKVASKFMRLMGIKSATGESSTLPNESEKKSPVSTSPPNNPDVKSREAMFCTMEQQYEVARQVTHTMRGVGLGFGSQSRPY